MPLEIRAAEPSELSLVARLYHDVWHATQAQYQDRAVAAFRKLEWFEARLKSFPSLPLVALLDGRPVGFAAWSGELLGQLFVIPEEQGQGIGRGLLLGAEMRMRAEGTHAAKLHCLVGHAHARRFYERNGWSLKSLESAAAESAEGPKQVAHWILIKTL